MSTSINKDDIAVKSSKNCCKFKYRIRCFNSKGVGLILLWTVLVSVSIWYQYRQSKTLFSGLISKKSDTKLTWIPAFVVSVIFIVSAPISGWLADTKLGLYKVYKTGFIFLYIASVLASVLVLVLESLPTNSIVAQVASGVLAPIIYFIGSTGAAACLITTLQLGMDQMPDASAVNITSYIAWFVFCFFTGVWLIDVSFHVCSQLCLNNESSHVFGNYMDKMSVYSSNCTIFRQTFSLFPVVCMTAVLCSDFLLAKKWLIIEPKSTQSLKLIFKVLKFAAKHKAPVNRSALTYWEEDIPSRVDLGKSRYGGPFTTEQVEDVKTIFKLMAVSLPFFMIILTMYLLGCASDVTPEYITPWYYFIYNSNLYVLIGTLVYEFAIYPLLKNRLPSLLKTIGVVSFIIIVLSIVSLSLSVVKHFDSNLNTYVWSYIILEVIGGFLIMFTLSAALQFVCAQSPYSMRALMAGCVTVLIFSPGVVKFCLRMLLETTVPIQYYPIALNSLATGISIVGFVLHCLLARWYKHRVRDDIYTPHRLVEEVYERYLSHQT